MNPHSLNLTQNEEEVLLETQNEELRASELRYRRLFEAARDGILILDADTGRINDVNPYLVELLGFSHGEMVGRTVGELSPFKDIESNELMLEQLQRNGYVRYEDLPLKTCDGRQVAVEFVCNVYQAGDSKVIQCNIRDISERKRAEHLRAVSEERFRFLNALTEATSTLADPSQIMCVMTRMLGEHLYASRCAYADVEPDGEQFTILNDYTDGCASTAGNYQLSLFGERAADTLRSGQILIIRNMEVELRAGEGMDMFTTIGIKAIITCPLVKDGRLRAMMAVHQTIPRDWNAEEITIVQDVVDRCWATIERRAAEEKIHQLNTQLEERVTERTVQLQALNGELEAFSYSVSHDLRAPLRHIMGFVELLQKDADSSLSAKSLRHLSIISESAKRMGDLIDDLLTFSRIGREELQKRRFDLDALVRETLGEFQAETHDRSIDFKIHLLPEVWADRTLLRQVLLNLISNAIKFTSSRKEAEIEIGSKPGGDDETVIFIRDNGAGFESKYKEKLFGVFQRLHNQCEFEGTGIGLANVQRIISRHGGRVWAEGVVDGGATFYFSIPKQTEEHP